MKTLIILFILILVILYWNRILSREIKRRKEAENRFKMLSDVSFEGIFISKDGIILDTNKAASEIFEYEKSELINKSGLELIVNEHRDIVLNNITKGIEGRYEVYGVKKNGDVFPMEVSAKMVKQNNQSLRVTAIRDITAQKELEKNLREFNDKLTNQVEIELQSRLKLQKEKEAQEQLLIQQSKMAAMGELIGAIAHQWRQPLNALSLIIQGLQIRYKRGMLNEQEIDEMVKKSKRQIEFMSHTIDDFRNFFKPDKEKIKFNIINEIKNSYKIIDSQFNNRNINFELIESEIEIVSYPNEFKQVILNILNNAKDAIIEHKIEDGFIKVNVHQNNEKIVIEICDNGGGIKVEIMDKIFEPYISTKGKNGTGIGLAIGKIIVNEKLNGEIYVQNIEYPNQQKGAKFTIVL